MAKVWDARRAYREFHTECFWSYDPRYEISSSDVPWVADRLMRYGGTRGWERGAKLLAGGGANAQINWAHDTAWGFLPTLESELAGYQLHPIDLAINKLLALAGRNEPRDFFDVMDAHRDILPLGALCWAAAGKDPGFTPSLLLDLLRRRGNIRPEDVARLKFREVPDLTQLKREWLAALDAAEEFVTTRPPEELGCLYYSTSEQLFVGDVERVSAAMPHYGRHGGVLPLLSPSAE